MCSNTLVGGSKLNDRFYIYSGDNVTINGDAGNDYIYNFNINEDVSTFIIGGTGDDTIHLSENDLVIYANGDGNDVINCKYYENYAIKIKLTSGTIDSYIIDGFDVILKIADGSIKLRNGSGRIINIEDAFGNITSKTYGTLPSILNTNKDSNENTFILSGTSGDDYIYNDVSETTINSGAGDDFVLIREDFFNVERNVINTGDGNDSIFIDFTYESTINPGKGDDTITMNSHSSFSVVEYHNGDGNDVILGDGNYHTLNLVDCSIDEVNINGNDLILKINDNSITFKDDIQWYIEPRTSTDPVIQRHYNGTSNLIININNSSEAFANSGNNVLINSGSNDDTISNYGSDTTINAGDGDNVIHSYHAYTTINTGNGDG